MQSSESYTTISEGERSSKPVQKTRARLGVIGSGLIGGSMAKAAAYARYSVCVWDTDESIREDAVLKHSLGWALTPKVLVERSDIIIIATPSDVVADIVKSIAQYMRPGQILIDVSSTKVSPTLAMTAAPKGVHVIGSHPMAGRTPGGFANSSPDLFEGCVWVLCPPDGETVPVSVSRLIVDLGAHQIIVCSAEEHDRAVAAISHGVQASATSLAAAVNSIVAEERLPWMLAAGGWRDTTRIAESDPDMWVPVLIDNANNVLPVIEAVEERLARMREALKVKDKETLTQLIKDGSAARKAWTKNKDN